MRKTIRAFVLVLALAVPTLAGEIPLGIGGEIPNGAAAAGEIQNGVTGEIPLGVTSETPLLDLLLSLFSLI